MRTGNRPQSATTHTIYHPTMPHKNTIPECENEITNEPPQILLQFIEIRREKVEGRINFVFI